jgi:hypothetical protein
VNRFRLIPALFLVGFGLLGCTPGEPPSFEVRGTVNYDGKPVPKGTIYFDPVSQKGVKANMGFASIQDGKFDTKAAGRGVNGGSYSIRVGGFDGKVSYEAPFGAPLFPEYTMEKDLPKADSELTVEVPKAKK